MLRKDQDSQYDIQLTRGDRGCIRVSAMDEFTNKPYVFRVGDKVSFVAVPKKGYTVREVLRKDVFVEEEAEYVDIELTAKETKIEGMIDKKVVYWYNIVLNDDITIVGSDAEGEKLLTLYPEVNDSGWVRPDDPEEEERFDVVTQVKNALGKYNSLSDRLDNIIDVVPDDEVDSLKNNTLFVDNEGTLLFKNSDGEIHIVNLQ